MTRTTKPTTVILLGVCFLLPGCGESSALGDRGSGGRGRDETNQRSAPPLRDATQVRHYHSASQNTGQVNSHLPVAVNIIAKSLRGPNPELQMAGLLGPGDPLPDSENRQAQQLNADGDAHRRAKRYEQAVDAYKASIALWQQLTRKNPDDVACQRGLAEAYHDLGLAYSSSDQHQGARQAFEKAIPIYKRLADSHESESDQLWLGGAYCNLAHRLRRLKEYDTAVKNYELSITTLKDMLKSNPEHTTGRRFLANAFSGRGQAYSERGRHVEAIADLSTAIEYKLDTCSLFQSRGNAFAQTKQWKQAAADFKKAKDLHDTSPTHWIDHARINLQLGEIDEYHRACQQLLDRFGNSARGRTGNDIAWVCCLAPNAVSDLKRCVQLAKTAVATEPSEAAWQNTVGATLYRTGDFKAALEQLNKSVEIHGDGGSWADCLYLAMTHHRLDRSDEAREWLEKAIERIERTRQTEAQQNAGLSWATRVQQDLLRKEAENPAPMVVRRPVPSDSVDELLEYVRDLTKHRPEIGTAEPEWVRLALKTAAERIIRLEKDRWSEASQTALLVLLEDRIRAIRPATPEQRREAVNFVKMFLTAKLEKRLERRDVDLAIALAKALEDSGDRELAVEAYGAFAELTGKSDDEALLDSAEMMQKAARRLQSAEKD